MENYGINKRKESQTRVYFILSDKYLKFPFFRFLGDVITGNSASNVLLDILDVSFRGLQMR